MSIRETFESLTVERIEEMVREQRVEDLHLEFKTVADVSIGKDDRRNLARALSGFANSDGGLIVWGVDARPNAEGVDAASATRQITPLPRFLSRLNEFSGAAASPTIDGVQHRALPVAAGDIGFVVTLVPASDAGPHMAKLGEDRYFKRSGDRFVRLEHFDLEDMFGRRQRPVLALTHRVVRGGHPHDQNRRWDYSLILGLENSGRGPARAPYLGVLLSRDWVRYMYGIDGNNHDGLPQLASARDHTWLQYGASADTVIHPSTALDICAITCGPIGGAPPELSARYQIAAENFRLLEGELILTVAELAAAALGLAR